MTCHVMIPENNNYHGALTTHRQINTSSIGFKMKCILFKQEKMTM